MTTIASRSGETERVRQPLQTSGLSSRLAFLTVLAVLVAQILVYVPALSLFRTNWIEDRLIGAKMVALVLAAYPDGAPLPPEVQTSLLAGIPAPVVALRGNGTRWLKLRGDVPLQFGNTIDLRNANVWGCFRGMMRTLLWHGGGPSIVVGPGVQRVPAVSHVELIFDEEQLQEAMFAFSHSFFVISLLVSAITSALMFLVLHHFLVRPVHRLTANISAFSEAPEDSTRIIAPTGRTDEIGVAEHALARMQTRLAGELRQKRHLAELGLAVSKINHELRNMLTTAQLLGDRLAEVEDPNVKRVAPRLIRTLNRAISFCGATLAYGRAVERPPDRRAVALAPMLTELAELNRLAPELSIAWEIDVPPGFCVQADRDHLARILSNILRNAVQALVSKPPAQPQIVITAWRDGGCCGIRVADNGPGVPDRLRSRIFNAFETSERPDGTGLGLNIADELVRLHGGTLSLEPGRIGASFLIRIPENAG